MKPEEQATVDKVTAALLGHRFCFHTDIRLEHDQYVAVITHGGKLWSMSCRHAPILGYIYDSYGPLQVVHQGDIVPAGVKVDYPF